MVAFTVKGDGPPFVFIVRTDQDSKSYNTFIIIIATAFNVSVCLFVCLFVFFGLISIAKLTLMS